MRTGVIAKKVGMTRLFQEDGRHVPVTVLALENCQVVSVRTTDRDGYVAVQLGSGEAKQKNVAKPQREHFAKAEVSLKARVAEFRVADDALLDVGSTIAASHFVPGQLVDVAGHTQGKGFAGAMKRWGFGGMRATTAFRSATVRTVRRVTVRIRARSSRTKRWLATWVTVSGPSRILKLCVSTTSVA